MIKGISVIAAGLVLLPISAFADAAGNLAALLDGVDSIDTRFEQVILDRDGSRMQTATGHMLVKRPRQFRWHAEEPFEQLVVSDGHRVWVHDVDLEQVLERPLGEEVGETPALLLSGDSSKIAKEFEITEVAKQGRNVTYQLKPKNKEQLFDVLEISFKGAQPSAMRLEDSLGQKTVFEFIKPKINIAIDATSFEFAIPEGVDVIRHE